jgi:hypothetical protein
MPLQDRLILAHLKRTHINLTESLKAEEIQPEKIYKIDNNTRIEFEPIIEDVWKFSLINQEGSKEVGRIYKTSNKEYISRSITAPNIEKSGKTLIDSALELLAFLGEI